MYNKIKLLFNGIIQVLQKRRKLLDYIINVEKKARKQHKFIISQVELADYRHQAKDIVPGRFLQELTWEKLKRLPVYLDALRIRLERRLVDPGKDATKESRIKPFIQQIKIIRDRCGNNGQPAMTVEQRLILTEYQEMLSEFYVSVFAPELKTIFPVSEKKII